MNTDMKRRVFLKGSLAAGTVGVAVSAGLLAPQAVLAAWPKADFEAKKMGDLGGASGDITVKAPDIAENGAVVPVTVSHNMKADSVAIYASANGTPLVAMFGGPGAQSEVSTRIKMGKTGDVIAVVKSGGKMHHAKKSVKVTIGGCGG
jgi:sulfur-oxidizing protein SoxY